MKLQNDIELLPTIKKIGCYYLALGRIIELETGYEFTSDELNKIWLSCKHFKYIDYSNRIINPDKILKELADVTMNNNLNVVQVGEHLKGNTIYWQWAIKGDYTNYKYVIEEVKTNGVVGSHFILKDRNLNLLFDSYSFTKYNFEVKPRYLFYSLI